tara:strand:- start:720 stop:1358 length:639 start_codon:yes stop_codon:yes gene_type:complete
MTAAREIARLAPLPSTVSARFAWTSTGWASLTPDADLLNRANHTGKLLVSLNIGASPTYADGQVELRSEDGGDVSVGFHRAGFTACQLRHSSNGLILSGTSRTSAADLYVYGITTSASDVRLKTDIQIISNALEKVASLRGVTFSRVGTGERQTGVIAQDVQKVLPEAIKISDCGEGYLSVAYGNLVGLLIEAIKEQTARIEKLEACRDSAN